MKRHIFITLAVLAMTALASTAQPADGGRERHHGRGGDPAKMVERRVAHLTDVLNLTDEQQAAVRQILNDEVEQMRTEAKQPRERDREERLSDADRQSLEQVRIARQQQTDERINAVLTTEQQQRYAQLQQQRDSRQGPPHGGPHHGSRGERPHGPHHGPQADRPDSGGCCGGCCKTPETTPEE